MGRPRRAAAWVVTQRANCRQVHLFCHRHAHAHANANPCFSTGRDSYTDADAKEEIPEEPSPASFTYAYPYALISSSTIN